MPLSGIFCICNLLQEKIQINALISCLIWLFFIFLHPIAMIKFGKEMSERYKDYGCHTLYWMAFIAFPLAVEIDQISHSSSRWKDDRLHIGALLYPYLVVPLWGMTGTLRIYLCGSSVVCMFAHELGSWSSHNSGQCNKQTPAFRVM